MHLTVFRYKNEFNHFDAALSNDAIDKKRGFNI